MGVAVVIIVVIIIIIIVSFICYLSRKKKSISSMQKNTCTDVVWANNKKAERETSKTSINRGETELTYIEDPECNSDYLSENHEVNDRQS